MTTQTGPGANFDELERDLEALLREQNNNKSSPFDLDLDDLNIYRSGSAPPTVEGSRAAYGNFMNHRTNLDEGDDEELMRSHPAYLSYYYSNENINPRLPTPNVSKEEWRASHRLHAAAGGGPVSGISAGTGTGTGTGTHMYGGIGDRRSSVSNRENSSLFSAQPGIGSNRVMGVQDVGSVGSRRKSFADAVQVNLTLPSVTGHHSLSGSEQLNDLQPGPTSPTLARVRSLGASAAHSVTGSGLSRNGTPEPQLIRRTPSPLLPPVGVRMSNTEGGSHDLSGEILSAMANMKVGYGGSDEDLLRSSHLGSSVDAYRRMSSRGSGVANGVGVHQFPNGDHSGLELPGLGLTGRNSDYAAQLLTSQLGSGGVEGEYLKLTRNQAGSGYNTPMVDSGYSLYPPHTPTESALNASPSADPYMSRNYLGSSQINLLTPEYQKAYISALIAQQKQQYNTGTPYFTKSYSSLNRGAYGGMPYTTESQLPGSFVNSLTAQSRARQSERMTRAASLRSFGSDHSGFGDDSGYVLSLLEDFKSSKAKFELPDIVGHVVEFSSDQYGSRFIQQKLETATEDEKNKIFPEILPNARALMTDVFGNYVIQKFFEYGTPKQRKLLATHLKGHVLQLSLQMYGCRVIQKALEVVDIDQQTQMVQELDGSIMRCVRDQNGNHVIQKCIECVPQNQIHFIISSFFGHVVELSMHPYGCRVIQRVLEYCNDPETQSIMMTEILPSVCSLALDQYGNYVIQHVLQHGKPEERSTIIKELAGQIVKMSQHKFASNVVEKCLTFGTDDERQILIDEILGTTDENEPLQVMMKDQFGNYVVQKVMETCDEQNRELIISRIKVHLNALKRYTYGKHIVARVEKLLAAGERVSAAQ